MDDWAKAVEEWKRQSPPTEPAKAPEPVSVVAPALASAEPPAVDYASLVPDYSVVTPYAGELSDPATPVVAQSKALQWCEAVDGANPREHREVPLQTLADYAARLGGGG